jgi:pectinesterase
MTFAGQATPELSIPQPIDAIVDVKYAGPEGALVDRIKRYTKIETALNDAPADSTKAYRISIKNGRYYEKLTVDKPFVTMIGESLVDTVITHDTFADTIKPDGTTHTTWGSATMTVSATDLTVENLTIENGWDYPANAAKPDGDPTKAANTQAVALRTDKASDKGFFKNVRLIGYQDTLFVESGRHYFAKCYIAGHVDFIFGAGQVVFEDCHIVTRDRRDPDKTSWIVAPSTSIRKPYGFLFLNCRLKKETPALPDGSVALGRPWHPTTNWPDGTRSADPNAIGSAVFKNCWMDSHISAKGWDSMHGWDKNRERIWFHPQDARFFEYGSTGPGAIVSETRRVLSEDIAQEYTIANVLNGWDPSKKLDEEEKG